jgi:hypothetical protein
MPNVVILSARRRRDLYVSHSAHATLVRAMAAALVATRRRGTSVQNRSADDAASDTGRVFPSAVSIIEDLELRVLLGRHATSILMIK